MSFLQRLKMSLIRFMQGRHGPDNLGMFTLFTGLGCSIIGSITGVGILSLLGMGLADSKGPFPKRFLHHLRKS